MKLAKVTYLLPSSQIICRCSSGIGRFERRAGPHIQTVGMSPATPPWSSSSSLEASSSSSSWSCSCSSSSSGVGDLARGPLVLLLLLPLLVVCDVPASSSSGGTDELASPLLLLVLPPAIWEDSPLPATLRSTTSNDYIIPPPRPTIFDL